MTARELAWTLAVLAGLAAALAWLAYHQLRGIVT